MRIWFNSNIHYGDLEIDKSIDELFKFMKLAFLKYFHINEAISFDELIIKAKKENILKHNSFIKWIEESGKDRINRILEIKFPNQQDYISEFKYLSYLIEEEVMNCTEEYENEIRSLLITIIAEHLEHNMNIIEIS